MRIFISLWISLIAAILSQVILYNLPFGASILHNADLRLVSNMVFVVMLGLLIWRGHRSSLFSLKVLASLFAFLTTCLAVVMAAAYVMPWSIFLGMLMSSPVGTIGSYPYGPDVPLREGALIWSMSAIMPIGTGLVLGLLLRKLRPSVAPGELQ